MTTRGPRVVLLGRQGAGKGTQSSRLAEEFGVEHLSTGDLFRAAAAEGTVAGRSAKAFMDRGELVPDDLVLEVVEERFRRNGLVTRGFVLDGFPRTRPQAVALGELLARHPLDVVIDLAVSIELVLHRIAGRRVCVNCGTLYHVDQPPAQDWSCDRCGGHVLQRDDDTEAAVLRRLELYEEQTAPLIDFYRDAGTLTRVDGEGDAEEVFGRLADALRSRFDPKRP